MALPSRQSVPEGGKGGTIAIDSILSNQSAQEIENMFPGMSYLGAGQNGIVYTCGHNLVCKLTDVPAEADVARFAMNEKPPCLVPVYDVRHVQEDPDVWLIVMQRVQPLPHGMAVGFRAYVHGRSKEAPREVAEFFECLHDTGIRFNDVYPPNLGWYHGRLMLLDLDPLD